MRKHLVINGSLVVVAAAIGILILFFFPGHENLSNLMLGTFSSAIFLTLVGLEKQPIRIIKFNEKNNSIDVKIYHRQVAEEMARRDRSRPSILNT